jgi:hypothetical protein
LQLLTSVSTKNGRQYLLGHTWISRMTEPPLPMMRPSYPAQLTWMVSPMTPPAAPAGANCAGRGAPHRKHSDRLAKQGRTLIPFSFQPDFFSWCTSVTVPDSSQLDHLRCIKWGSMNVSGGRDLIAQDELEMRRVSGQKGGRERLARPGSRRRRVWTGTPVRYEREVQEGVVT